MEKPKFSYASMIKKNDDTESVNKDVSSTLLQSKSDNKTKTNKTQTNNKIQTILILIV